MIELPLFDDATCWVPGADALLASVAIQIVNETSGISWAASLCTLEWERGLYRRLTYDLERARLPALRPGSIAFVAGTGDLRTAPIDPQALRIPVVKVFPLPELEAGTARAGR